MKIKGRYFLKPTVDASFNPETGKVHIRLDCETNPEQWVEIEISQNEWNGIVGSDYTSGRYTEHDNEKVVLVHEVRIPDDAATPATDLKNYILLGDKVEEISSAFGTNGSGFRVILKSTGQRLYVQRVYMSIEEAQNDLRNRSKDDSSRPVSPGDS